MSANFFYLLELREHGSKMLRFIFRCCEWIKDAQIHLQIHLPRGQARGLTWFIPADDPTLISKHQLFARIVGGLGGRAAEEVIFGEPEVTTGAAGDLQQITGLAKQVTNIRHDYLHIGI
ncbi:putative peptidase M41 [Rosa chinensis]|uniref:Putative peptidase M41 n=1 Tax=Rosa chinensis TaxID=74649 RepID=A0A2P6QIS7_ROSCH|nr:putative peptidase M41 [Rosa chinensis]